METKIREMPLLEEALELGNVGSLQKLKTNSLPMPPERMWPDPMLILVPEDTLLECKSEDISTNVRK